MASNSKQSQNAKTATTGPIKWEQGHSENSDVYQN